MVGRSSILLGVLALVFIARVAVTYPVFSATFDEGFHIAAGVDHYQNRDFGIYFWNPPLARYAVGALPYLNGVRIPSGEEKERVRFDHFGMAQAVLGSGSAYWSTLTLARIGTLLFLPWLLIVVYRWGRLAYGRAGGLSACVLLTCSPTVIAHGSLATVDFAAATTLATAAFFAWRWLDRPSTSGAVKAAVAAAGALLTKFSAVVFLPLLLAPYLGSFLIAQRRAVLDYARKLTPGALLWAPVVWCVIWVGYLFRSRPIESGSIRLHGYIGKLAAEGGVLHDVLFNVSSHVLPWILPPMDFLRGLEHLGVLAKAGHPAYLLGETGTNGWWYYFPVALALKSTLPLLLLAAAGAFLAASSKEARRAGGGRIEALLGAAAVMAIALLGNIALGVRYILPIYPFLAILGGGAFQAAAGARSRALAAAAWVLLGWHAAESAWSHPDYLAYFNQIGRGREASLLSDSNLDWGQDLERLRRYLDENRIDRVHLAYFGTNRPEQIGLMNSVPLGVDDRPLGWVAVSVTFWQGAYLDGGGYSWLHDYAPHAVIGKSIYLYDFSGGYEGAAAVQ